MPGWDPAFAIGSPTVDEQHRSLFERVAELEAALAVGRPVPVLRDLLGFLGRYAGSHFQAEEALMREIGYPDLEPHLREHADFIRRLHLLVPLWEEEEDSVVVLTTLLAFVRGWLVEHVTGSDQGIGAHLRGPRAAARRGRLP
jgi:hemerythrin